ncbi:MAG TPA: hypothetical protein VM070_03990 [Candidatus Saccharimonadales bacterium]|nr:hypothetical protein [Candidatus Saccharimonadales bacterium]
MRVLSFALAFVGAVTCAAALAPVLWIERGKLPPLTASYFWMMIMPAIAVAIVLAYQWNRRIDRGSSIVLIVIGIATGLYPMWGPTFLPDMKMKLDWIGTIISMYLPGLLIVAAGLLQLSLPASGRQAGKAYRGAGPATS